MSLVVEPLALPAVLLVTPPRFADARGYFTETYTQAKFVAAGIAATFIQDNQSLSTARGTIRGLHFQVAPAPQAKLVRAISGALFDVAVDLRPGSPSFGQWCGATLTAEGGEQLFIPRGFAHAFCTLAPDTVVAYKVDGAYDRAAERGLRFDDPDLAIRWPLGPGEAKLSDKDAVLPYLRDVATGDGGAPFDFGP